MFDRTMGLSRRPAQQQPAQRQPGQQQAPQQVASHLTRANLRSVALNGCPPNLKQRDPATDPCFRFGHVARALTSKIAALLGIPQRRTQAAAALAKEVADRPSRG